MVITYEKLKSIQDKFLNLDQYVLLFSKYYANGWTRGIRLSERDLLQLEEENYLTPTRMISVKGRNLVEEIEAVEGKDPNRWSKELDQFWEAYPTDDGHNHYKPTRTVRSGKHETKLALNNVLDKGIQIQELIKALKNHVNNTKSSSMTSGKNGMKYFPSPSKWLKDEQYMVWLNRESSKQTTPKNLPDVT